MIKKLFLIITALSLSVTLTACRGAGENIKNDRRFMVSALGFETDGFLIKVTSELIIINSEDPETSPQAKTFSAKSSTVTGALEDISARLSRPMLLEHCGIIAIGDQMNEKRFSEICDYCFAENRITLSAYMISVPDPEELLSGEPESSAAVGYDIMNIIEQQNAANGINTNSRFFEVESARESGKSTFFLPRFEKTESGAVFRGIAVFEHDKQKELVSRENISADSLKRILKR